jgi:Carboxypeptidase regulatory-like domain
VRTYLDADGFSKSATLAASAVGGAVSAADRPPLPQMARANGFLSPQPLLRSGGPGRIFCPTRRGNGASTSASIRGRVADYSDAVIGGASFTVRQRQTGAERIGATQADGQYQVENLEPGEYEIEVRAPGFRTELRRLTLRAGDNVTINIELQVGRISEQVEVTGEASGINITEFKVDGSSRPRSNREPAAQRPELPRARPPRARGRRRVRRQRRGVRKQLPTRLDSRSHVLSNPHLSGRLLS